MMTDYLGWAATAVFVASYFFTHPQAIKRVQMIGALMWATYGILIGASPVIAANMLVFGAAAWTTIRDSTNSDRRASPRRIPRSPSLAGTPSPAPLRRAPLRRA
jgi:hypothetical protein